MSKEYDYSFDMKGKSFHLFNDEKTAFSTNFNMSTKNQNIWIVQKMGINNNLNIIDENMEYIPSFRKNIKGKINYIFLVFVDMPFIIKRKEREREGEKRREDEEGKKENLVKEKEN